MPPQPETYVYAYGFNLYFGAVKHTSFKWLNLDALCRNLLPNNHIAKIKYLTARVSAKLDAEAEPLREKLKKWKAEKKTETPEYKAAEEKATALEREARELRAKAQSIEDAAFDLKAVKPNAITKKTSARPRNCWR
jgi:hypothetical protein